MSKIKYFKRTSFIRHSVSVFILVLLIEIVLSGCATTEESAEVAMTAPIYAAIAVPAILTYPFWKAATHDPYEGKSKSTLLEEYGEPAAIYDCDGLEIWEYEKNKNVSPRFLRFYSTRVSGTKFVPFLDECNVIEGSPTDETKKLFSIKTYACGKNYYKHACHKYAGRKFIIDMKATDGVFSIKHYRGRSKKSNADFEITYEGEVIYTTPPPFIAKGGKRFLDEVKYGPGKSTLVGVRINNISDRMYELRISCPR